MTDEVYKHYFPVGQYLKIGVRARRDGAPIAWRQISKGPNIPIFAIYVVLDEFDTPVLDPSCCEFDTGEEAIVAAEAYSRLVLAKHPCADRMFHDTYVLYFKLRKRLIDLCLEWVSIDEDRKEKRGIFRQVVLGKFLA